MMCYPAYALHYHGRRRNKRRSFYRAFVERMNWFAYAAEVKIPCYRSRIYLVSIDHHKTNRCIHSKYLAVNDSCVTVW